MPTNRWQTNLREILSWIENGEGELSELILLSSDLDNTPSDEDELIEKEIAQVSDTNLPDTLPILPLRGLVVYPQTAIPLTIGQPRSIRLVDEVMSSDQRLIGLVTAKDPNLENPNPEDLYSVGTAALVHRLFRAPDGSIRLLVQGTVRFQLGEFVQAEPFLVAKVTLLPEKAETGIEIEALARNARDQFEHIAEMIPSIPRELVASISTIEDPLQTVYTIANLQRMELVDAQSILELDLIGEKLHKLVSILTRESEVLELGQKIQNEARSEIEKVQREYFLREQKRIG